MGLKGMLQGLSSHLVLNCASQLSDTVANNRHNQGAKPSFGLGEDFQLMTDRQPCIMVRSEDGSSHVQARKTARLASKSFPLKTPSPTS